MPKRVDQNQAEIVKALRDFGCSVQPIYMVGHGCPDLLVGYKDMNLLLEVKVGNAKLNELETKWHESWQGWVGIARTPGHAVEIVGWRTSTDIARRSQRREKPDKLDQIKP